MQQLLREDAEYQRLKAEHKRLDEENSKALHAAYSYRISVGILGSMFFSEKAHGDTWQEVVDKVCAKETTS